MKYILEIKKPDSKRVIRKQYKTWKKLNDACLRYEEQYMACCTMYQQIPRGFEQLNLFDEDEPDF